MTKKKAGRPPKYGPDGPLKRSQRRKVASAVNKDGTLRKRHVPFTPAKQREYLEKLAETGLIAHTCRELNISREMVRYERKKNPAFAELEDAAKQYFAETLEQEAVRRAREGVQKPVFYKGSQVGHVTEFSDRLMEILLKGHIPEKYKDGLRGGDTNVQVSGVLVINQRGNAEDWEKQASQASLPKPDEVDGGEIYPVAREADDS